MSKLLKRATDAIQAGDDNRAYLLMCEHEEREARAANASHTAVQYLRGAMGAAERGENEYAADLARRALVALEPALQSQVALHALAQLLDAVTDFVHVADIDIGHCVVRRLAHAKLRATHVLYPGTTRHG